MVHNLPPGTAMHPEFNPDVPMPSELVEEILGVLEDGGVPTEINDKIVTMVEEWENSKEL